MRSCCSRACRRRCASLRWPYRSAIGCAIVIGFSALPGRYRDDAHHGHQDVRNLGLTTIHADAIPYGSRKTRAAVSISPNIANHAHPPAKHRGRAWTPAPRLFPLHPASRALPTARPEEALATPAFARRATLRSSMPGERERLACRRQKKGLLQFDRRGPPKTIRPTPRSGIALPFARRGGPALGQLKPR
jgi:hypothetical protein